MRAGTPPRRGSLDRRQRHILTQMSTRRRMLMVYRQLEQEGLGRRVRSLHLKPAVRAESAGLANGVRAGFRREAGARSSRSAE